MSRPSRPLRQTDISADEATLAPLGPEPNPAIVIDSAESIAGGNWGDEVLHPSTDRRGGWGYPVRERARPLFELMTPMRYTNLQQMLDGAAPWGIMCYEKRLFLDDLSDDVIRAFEEHFHRKNSPLSVVPIQLLRAAYTRVGDDETAFAVRRRRPGASASPGRSPLPNCWRPSVHGCGRSWRPCGAARATLPGTRTTCLKYEEDLVRATFGPANHDRLARIKAVSDPTTSSPHNANVKPAT
jgi:hypothetical protein